MAFIRVRTLFIGEAEVRRNLAKKKDDALDAAILGMNATASEIIGTAIPRTPRDTGALRRSARIHPPEKMGGDRIQQFVSYGQMSVVNEKTGLPTSRYAVTVHEVQRNYNEGMFKFLETAVNEHTDRYRENLQRFIRKVL